MGTVAGRVLLIFFWRNCSKLKKKKVLLVPSYTLGIRMGPPIVKP